MVKEIVDVLIDLKKEMGIGNNCMNASAII